MKNDGAFYCSTTTHRGALTARRFALNDKRLSIAFRRCACGFVAAASAWRRRVKGVLVGVDSLCDGVASALARHRGGGV